MGEVVNVSFSPTPADGGKSRILRRRDNFRFRSLTAPTVDIADDLLMDHADPCDLGIPSDSPYSAPDHDSA